MVLVAFHEHSSSDRYFFTTRYAIDKQTLRGSVRKEACHVIDSVASLRYEISLPSFPSTTYNADNSVSNATPVHDKRSIATYVKDETPRFVRLLGERPL